MFRAAISRSRESNVCDLLNSPGSLIFCGQDMNIYERIEDASGIMTTIAVEPCCTWNDGWSESGFRDRLLFSFIYNYNNKVFFNR